MNQKRSERKAEWRGRQEELRAQEYQPFLSPTQVPINDLLLCWERGERKPLRIFLEVTFPGYIFLHIFTVTLQIWSAWVSWSRDRKVLGLCFVVSYETFYPNSAYTLPGLQMGTDTLLRSPDEMQGMGAFLGILDPRKKSSAGWARANFLNSSWLSSLTSRNRIRSGSQLNQSWMQTLTILCGVCESLSQPFLEMSRNAPLENALKNGCEKDWAWMSVQVLNLVVFEPYLHISRSQGSTSFKKIKLMDKERSAKRR